MGLGGEVDHDVRLGDQRVDGVSVGDVADDEGDALAQVRQGSLVAGVGELVQDRDLGVWVTYEGLVDKVGTDEAGTSGDEDVHVQAP